MPSEASIQSATGAQARYRFLGLRVAVAADDRAFLPFLDSLYARFRDGEPGEADLRASFSSAAGAAAIEVDGRRVALAPPPLTEFHAYTILFGEILDRLSHCFFLHAAAVSDGTRTIVAAGPSGHGKTTLALALGRLGFRLLSDDFAPLRRADGRVEPFPKQVGIARRDVPPEPARGGTGSAEAPAFGDKRLVDPGALPGGVEGSARPLTHLLLLADPEDATEEATFRIATAGDPAPLGRALAALDGVEVRPGRSGGGWPLLEVRVRGPARAAFHARCLAEREELLLFEPMRARSPFAAVPGIEPLPRLDAAMALMREVLNRAPGGALLRDAGGSASVLLLELAALLDRVSCARLRLGAPSETAALVARWVTGDPA